MRSNTRKPNASASACQRGRAAEPDSLARKKMKNLFNLAVLISVLFCPQCAIAILESEVIVHQDDINLKTSSGWSGTSLPDLFKDDAIKEVHLIHTLNRGDKDTV